MLHQWKKLAMRQQVVEIMKLHRLYKTFLLEASAKMLCDFCAVWLCKNCVNAEFFMLLFQFPTS